MKKKFVSLVVCVFSLAAIFSYCTVFAHLSAPATTSGPPLLAEIEADGSLFCHVRAGIFDGNAVIFAASYEKSGKMIDFFTSQPSEISAGCSEHIVLDSAPGGTFKVMLLHSDSYVPFTDCCTVSIPAPDDSSLDNLAFLQDFQAADPMSSRSAMACLYLSGGCEIVVPFDNHCSTWDGKTYIEAANDHTLLADTMVSFTVKNGIYTFSHVENTVPLTPVSSFDCRFPLIGDYSVSDQTRFVYVLTDGQHNTGHTYVFSGYLNAFPIKENPDTVFSAVLDQDQVAKLVYICVPQSSIVEKCPSRLGPCQLTTTGNGTPVLDVDAEDLSGISVIRIASSIPSILGELRLNGNDQHLNGIQISGNRINLGRAISEQIRSQDITEVSFFFELTDGNGNITGNLSQPTQENTRTFPIPPLPAFPVNTAYLDDFICDDLSRENRAKLILPDGSIVSVPFSNRCSLTGSKPYILAESDNFPLADTIVAYRIEESGSYVFDHLYNAVELLPMTAGFDRRIPMIGDYKINDETIFLYDSSDYDSGVRLYKGYHSTPSIPADGGTHFSILTDKDDIALFVYVDVDPNVLIYESVV